MYCYSCERELSSYKSFLVNYSISHKYLKHLSTLHGSTSCLMLCVAKPVYVKVGYAANFDNSIIQNILIITEYLTLMLGFTLN